MLTAWADESGSRPDLDPGAYLLSAALCDAVDVAEIREVMESLRLGEAKVHWHASSDKRRGELIDAVSRLPMTSLVVVHVDPDAAGIGVVCGAVVQARIGHTAYLDTLGSAVELHLI